MEIATLIGRLRELPGFPSDGVPIEVRQTHASVVVIAGDDVYKLKKPVNFGFLDYSTVKRRRAMCRAEVRLNRRLAPTVYLGTGELRPNAGEPGDWVVHMRRLDDAASLEAMVRDRRASPGDMERAAELVARFHREARRGPDADAWGSPAVIVANVAENFEQIAPFVGQALSPAMFDSLRSYGDEVLLSKRALFEARVSAGCIAECHGDLRAEHVYFEPEGISVIDCVEFSERYRCQDVASDVAFLTMDLERLGRPDLAQRFLARYEELTPYRVRDVLDFYGCYRAVVRGKVACLRSAGEGMSDSQREAAIIEAIGYFGLALRLARGEPRPLLAVMCGLTGTGKSTLAERLGPALGTEVLVADVVRKELAGLAANQRVADAPDAGLYSERMNERVYHELLRRARLLLRSGRSVLLDGTYRREADRAAAREAAERCGARFVAVECVAAEPLIRDRLDRRWAAGTSPSDGRWEVYLAQKAAYEPPRELAAAEHIVVDSAATLADQVLQAVDRLAKSH